MYMYVKATDINVFTNDVIGSDAIRGRQQETTYKLPVSSEAARILMPKLKLEYKFYNFIRMRFRRLHAALKQAQSRYPDR